MSFYTTELPEYMLVELARGLNPGVINAAGAATYTALLASRRCWPGAGPPGRRDFCGS